VDPRRPRAGCFRALRDDDRARVPDAVAASGLWFELFGNGGYQATINYGVNRVRFPAPVPVPSRVRASFSVSEVTQVDGGEQAVIAATIERERHDKPVCVAELVFRFIR